MSEFGLGTTKQSLYQRFRPAWESERSKFSYQLGKDVCYCITKVLIAVGITFPVLYLIPNVLKTNFRRQGKLVVPPLTKFTWRFEATRGSVLVIRRVHFMPLDFLSTKSMSIKWRSMQLNEGGSERFSSLNNEKGAEPTESAELVETCSPSSYPTDDPNTAEIPCHPGVVKPMMLILDPREVTEIILRNISTDKPVFCDFELKGWYL